MSDFGAVRDFHVAFGVEIGDSWTKEERRALRVRLITEEFHEYVDAEICNDKVLVADALADLLYVIHGCALEYGIPLDLVFAEVHRSNMAKLGPDGKPLLRPDGKILKPDGWTPPNIAGILAKST
jgi:predicted HAD superfamily Cof-like phosphohydrolase